MNKNLVWSVKLQPEIIESFTLLNWDLFVRQARAANLLAHFCAIFSERGSLEHIAEKPRTHLESARVTAEKQEWSVRWEVQCLRNAIMKTGYPFVLLKGAAYVLSEVLPSHGRIFSDIDILVPKHALSDIEKTLTMHGWHSTHHDKYDQHYYRKWMHELPPMQHVLRLSVLDVHHNILPETAKLHPSPDKLLRSAIPVEGLDEIFILQPVDMVLHSATHLFHDGELENGLRDLCDLDCLLIRFGKDEGFWQKLGDRAKELDLERPLFYALRYTNKILETPVPEHTFQACSTGKPNGLVLMIIDYLFLRGLKPDHPSCHTGMTGFARWVLYVRSHYLRMPFHLLVPHLIRKAFRQKSSH